LHGKEQTSHVGVERLVEMVLGYFAEFPGLVESGVDHQHVNAARLRLDGLSDPVDIGEVGGVALNRCDIAAKRCRRFVEFRLTAPGYEYMRAFGGQLPGNTQANSRAAAGNYRNFVLKFTPHRVFRLVWA
jgi:hypothetical protein